MLGSKLISLARFLILARLLAPEEFGLLAIAAVAVEMLVALSNIGVNEALVQREHLRPADFHTAWTLRILRAAAVAGIVAVTAPFIADAFGEPAATPFLRVLALRPLVDAAGSIRLVNLTRSLEARPLALMQVSTMTLDAVGSILLVTLLPVLIIDTTVSVALGASIGAWAVVAGAFAGSTTGLAISYRLAPHRPRPQLDGAAVRSLISFGKWLFVTSTVGMIGHVVLRAVVSRRLGTAELGIFYLGLKLTLLPNDVAGEVVRAVAFPLVAKVQHDVDRTRRAFQGSLTAMLVLLVPVYAAMFVLARPLVEHVLGATWAPMVPVIQFLAIDGIVDVLADAAKPLVLGLGRPERRALLKTVRTLVIVAVAWPLAGTYGLAGAAATFLIAEAVQMAAAVLVVQRTLPRPFAGMAGRVGAIATAAAGGGGAAWLLYQAVAGPLGLGAAVVAAGVVAIAGLLLADRWFDLELTAEFARAFPAVAARLGAGVEPV